MLARVVIKLVIVVVWGERARSSEPEAFHPACRGKINHCSVIRETSPRSSGRKSAGSYRNERDTDTCVGTGKGSGEQVVEG